VEYRFFKQLPGMINQHTVSHAIYLELFGIVHHFTDELPRAVLLRTPMLPCSPRDLIREHLSDVGEPGRIRCLFDGYDTETYLKCTLGLMVRLSL
jgi:hypothetical protein